MGTQEQPTAHRRKSASARASEKRRVAKVKARRIALLRSLKAGPCTDCRGLFPYYVMDFDHVRGVKQFDISTAAYRNHSYGRFLAEIAKCEVVCANCHRIREHNRSRN